MKVYRFYDKPSEESLADSEDLSIHDKYPLYAFTNDKEVRNRFVEERNPEKYIEIKSKMSSEEYVDFANSKSGCRLQEFDFLHCNDYYNTHNTTHVKVLATWNEKEQCQACLDDSLTEINYALDYDFFPFMFKSKYMDALIKLEYIAFWKLAGKVDKYRQFLTSDEDDMFLDYSYPNVTYDELSMFIWLYGDKFK